MQLFSKHRFIVLYILFAAVAIGAGAWYYSTKIYVPEFPINSADVISSWDFKGAYTENATLVTKAKADISHLTDLLGKGEYDDYDLYNGIANDYGFLGDGKKAYEYYNRAINIHTNKGLAYVNLAHFLEQVGGYNTAADAYTRAVTVEPAFLEYHIERMNFLTERFATNKDIISSGFDAANKQFGDNASLLAIKAEWLVGQKQYTEAIKIWEIVKMFSPKDRQVSIQAEITRLKAKQ